LYPSPKTPSCPEPQGLSPVAAAQRGTAKDPDFWVKEMLQQTGILAARRKDARMTASAAGTGYAKSIGKLDSAFESAPNVPISFAPPVLSEPPGLCHAPLMLWFHGWKWP